MKTNAQIYPNAQRYRHETMPNDCIPAEIFSKRKNNIKSIKLSSSSTICNYNNQQKVGDDWIDPMIANMIIINEERVKIIAKDTVSKIHITSDGGVHNYEGTFGVIISDGSSPIVSTNGKLYIVDFFESSYRSEMYSMLAGIMTLNNINKHYNIDTTSTRKLYLHSDNKALIKKINNRRKVRRTVNQHCDSDVDLELQLLYEIHELE